MAYQAPTIGAGLAQGIANFVLNLRAGQRQKKEDARQKLFDDIRLGNQQTQAKLDQAQLEKLNNPAFYDALERGDYETLSGMPKKPAAYESVDYAALAEKAKAKRMYESAAAVMNDDSMPPAQRAAAALAMKQAGEEIGAFTFDAPDYEGMAAAKNKPAGQDIASLVLRAKNAGMAGPQIEALVKMAGGEMPLSAPASGA
jgi:hypothetical protein